MQTSTNTNMLNELARNITTDSSHTTAIALRKLAQAGYENLDQVDHASDWFLLSIPGVGIGRLSIIRRMTRARWRPPSQQAVRAASRLLSASRFALRFWSPEDLEASARGSRPAGPNGLPYEQRLALDLFSRAAQRALNHCRQDEILQILRSAEGGHWRPSSLPSQPVNTEVSPPEMPSPEPPDPRMQKMIQSEPSKVRESDHFAYPRDKRYEIVQTYREARQRGEVKSKARWAQSRYNIGAKTLLSYVREFPEP